MNPCRDSMVLMVPILWICLSIFCFVCLSGSNVWFSFYSVFVAKEGEIQKEISIGFLGSRSSKLRRIRRIDLFKISEIFPISSRIEKFIRNIDILKSNGTVWIFGIIYEFQSLEILLKNHKRCETKNHWYHDHKEFHQKFLERRIKQTWKQ